MNRNYFGLILVAALAVGSGQLAHAGMWFDNVSGAPEAGAKYVNFNGMNVGHTGGIANNINPPGPAGFISVLLTPNSSASSSPAVVTGSQTGIYAPPYVNSVSGTNAVFGNAAVGPDQSKYLTTGLGTIVLGFQTPIYYFGLLWGSIDEYNTLAFYGPGGNFIESFAGNVVYPNASGGQEDPGSLYINFYSTEPISSVVATSTGYAFEFDNVAYATPEAATLTIWSGLGLCGWYAYRRNRK